MQADPVKTALCPPQQVQQYLQILARQGKLCPFEPEQVLLEEGEESSHLYILLSGRL
jgi:CRP-like cAMP-binding protein